MAVYQVPPAAPPRPPQAGGGLARAWATVVGLAALGLVLNNVLALVFNIDEHGYQAKVAAGQFVDPDAVHRTLANIKSTSNVSLVLTVIYVALVIIWSTKRHRQGMASTRQREPLLWRISWILAVVAILINVRAGDIANTASTHAEAARYRSYVAAGDGVRAVFWACCVLIAVRAAFSGRVATREQRNDLAGSLGNVGAGTEYSGNPGPA